MKSKSIDFLFLAAFLFIGITFYSTYTNIRKQESFNDMVDHTYLVKNRILDLESEFRSMVSNQRSFLLCGEQQYLQTYRSKASELDSLVENLKSIVGDNPIQQANLDTLNKNLLNTKYVLRQQLDLKEKGGIFTNKKLKDHISETDQYADRYHKEIKDMAAIEDQLLKERLVLQYEGERLTSYAFILLGILSFAIIAFAYFKQKHDLNEKERLLVNKRKLLKNLLNSNAELEEYAYLASHDLKEPLRKIQVFSDIASLAHEKGDHEKVKNQLAKIDKSAAEAGVLVDGLLEHAQLERNENDLSLQRFSDLFNTVSAEFRAAIKPDLNLKIEFEETPMFTLYEGQILDLLRNLFSNSVKFRKEGEKTVEVSLLYEQIEKSGESYHKISIQDKGSGFDQSEAKSIFEIFSNLNLHPNSKNKNVGLSLCKKVMDNHHGEIEVQSEKNIGTTFILLFPKTI
ncbi:sensor histidine kinase [Jiulongibacter sp. NS-SX5]|uniref:sensor histidine kinase n=1 Tax=Jiulongibacter sp. NS-SX5 TaxID=3463854 RepID=UPI004058F13B